MRFWPSVVLVLAVKVAPLLAGIFVMLPSGASAVPEVLIRILILAGVLVFFVGCLVGLLARRPLEGFDYALTAVGVLGTSVSSLMQHPSPAGSAAVLALLTGAGFLGAFAMGRWHAAA